MVDSPIEDECWIEKVNDKDQHLQYRAGTGQHFVTNRDHPFENQNESQNDDSFENRLKMMIPLRVDQN